MVVKSSQRDPGCSATVGGGEAREAELTANSRRLRRPKLDTSLGYPTLLARRMP